MKKKRRNSLLQWFFKPYYIVFVNKKDLKQERSFSASNALFTGYVFAILVAVVLITIYLVAFTSIKQSIPGYVDVSLAKKVYKMEKLTDSLLYVCQTNDHYIHAIKQVLRGDVDTAVEWTDQLEKIDVSAIQHTRSSADSALRTKVERRQQYDVTFEEDELKSSLYDINFFPPVKGIVTSRFNAMENHHGIDIVCKKETVVKAVLKGVVVYAGWSVETGNTIIIQHDQHFLSAYKHNAELLKSEGSHINAGEPIAILGNTGEYTTGPHLHFELWHEGVAVDPQEVIKFE